MTKDIPWNLTITVLRGHLVPATAATMWLKAGILLPQQLPGKSPPYVRQHLLWSDSLFTETYFPESFIHGLNSVLWPQRIVCLVIAPLT